MKKKILIIKYDNPGNIGSLINLLEIINKKNNNKYVVSVSQKPQDIKKTDIIILPGVGQFDQVISFLIKNKLVDALKKYSKKKIIIGICIGMQVLFNDSDEGSLKGLGFIQGKVRKIKDKKLPIIGWKKTFKSKNDKLLDDKLDEIYLYYLHSFHVLPKNKNNILMNSVINNKPIAALVRQKNIIGLQFHPELSSNSGFKILENILLNCY
jgi:glutamine amidotransferase